MDQEKLEKLKAVTNSYVLDSLRETETAVTDALAAVQSAREKFEALSAPEKKETPQPELPEEPAEAEAAEETAEETVDNA